MISILYCLKKKAKIHLPKYYVKSILWWVKTLISHNFCVKTVTTTQCGLEKYSSIKSDHDFCVIINSFSVKSMILLNKSLKSRFHEIFWAWPHFMVLFHTVLWTSDNYFVKIIAQSKFILERNDFTEILPKKKPMRVIVSLSLNTYTYVCIAWKLRKCIFYSSASLTLWKRQFLRLKMSWFVFTKNLSERQIIRFPLAV